jgi:diguanylate cyclase (GGDEF)-like protein
MDQSEHDTDKDARAPKSNPDVEYQRVLGKVTLRLVGKLDIQPGPLMAVMQASPDDPERVANALQQSSPLSARVLSVTNSAAIGVVGEISDIRRAVLHMGAARSRLIAMAFGIHMLTQETGLDPEIAHRMWVNSLEKACLAKHVAEATNSDHADHAYTLGLIQDIGLSALRAINPAFYQQVDAKRNGGEPLHILEQQHFGIDHAQAGNHLLQQWDASPLLCEEILNHHQPVLIRNDTSPANLGNLIAGMLPHDCESMTPDRMEWLIAVHGQFLSEAYNSPEALIKTATRSAQKIHSSATSVRIDAAARLRMLNEIEADTADMVRQLCVMETQLTHQHQQVSTLQFEAMTDPLTQVLNRRGFNRLAERRMQTAVERDLPICAMVLDLDGFKQINDTHGHEAGDRMLIELAQQVRKNIDSSDLFGRLGGDEFAILQINVDHKIARRIAHRVVETCMGHMVDLGDGKQAPLRFSVGAATCNRPNRDISIADLISTADEAMYVNKRSGSGGVTFVDFPARQQAS